MLLSRIIKSNARLKVLCFLCRQESFAQEIYRSLDLHLSAIQNQLMALRKEGLLRERRGRPGSGHEASRRYFSFDPKYPLYRELKALLVKFMRVEKFQSPSVSSREGKPLRRKVAVKKRRIARRRLR